MSSFFEDLKLLHPKLKLPRKSKSSTWRTKLVDPTISPNEWSANARDFLREIGGAGHHSLLAETGPATTSTPDHDDLFWTSIIGYVRRARFKLCDIISLKFWLMVYSDVEGIHKIPSTK